MEAVGTGVSNLALAATLTRKVICVVLDCSLASSGT